MVRCGQIRVIATAHVLPGAAFPAPISPASLPYAAHGRLECETRQGQRSGVAA